MLNAAQPHLLRVVGPNCLGFLSPASGINASFAHLTPQKGDIAFVSQSGALVTAVLDWAVGRGIGFSHIVSLGDMSDVDFGDLLDHLAQDAATRSILLYVESIKDARKFMTAARIAARAKPVIVIKSGRSSGGAKAAMSHTGALAGSDAVYDAAFGGGAGVLAADALDAGGGRLATLSPEVLAQLDAVLPAAWSRGNPIDIIGDASGQRFTDALAALKANTDQDAILVMNCPTGVVAPDESCEAVLASVTPRQGTPLLTCWLGEATAASSRQRFAKANVPSYETPDDAVRAFMDMVDYRRNQDLLMETPPAGVAMDEEGRKAGRAIVDAALAAGRTLLSAPESQALLAAYGVPTVETRIARTPEDAGRMAAAMSGPLALKILSPDISHKSDVGGVALGLIGGPDVAAAAEAMLATIAVHKPEARIEGFSLEPMVVRAGAQELIAGVIVDGVFGPVILFGQGGTAVEVLADRALGLPPLNPVLARDMIGRTRVSKLLAGYRDVPAANMAQIEATLIRLSDLAIDLPEVIELDINPLLADAAGVIALDARVVLRAIEAPNPRRLAIRPYPAELERPITLRDGQTLRVRPIRPEDAPALVEAGRRTSPEDLRLRFFGAMRSLPPWMAARLSQIDYDREMALIAFDPNQTEGPQEILGVVRLICDPDNTKGEFAIIVRSDQKGHGLGYGLMQEMLAWARRRGLAKVVGEVLMENAAMLHMVGDLDGVVESRDAEHRIAHVVFDLGPSGQGAEKRRD